MQLFIQPNNTQLQQILLRPQQSNNDVIPQVERILEQIKQNGDEAICALTKQIDKVELTNFLVSTDEIQQAEKLISDELKQAIRQAIDNITKFHAAQCRADITVETSKGVKCMQRAVPIQNIGLYIPGGTAPLFSTVLMLAIPAKLANCPNIILCSPPDKQGNIHPAILYAATQCGVTKIFKIGGAMAVGAMAYGTESVPKVNKIFGPGNQYVMAAKQIVSVNNAAIDMPAGPSEVLVLADDTAIPEFVAADLLSQAEHGIDSQVILACTSLELANKVIEQIQQQLSLLERQDISTKALTNSAVIVVNSPQQLVDIANQYSAEHLIIATKNAWELALQIQSAGSIFIGNYSPESAGDYVSGTNHTLPTSGWAQAYSGVNIDSFTKKITYQEITKEGLQNIGQSIEIMASAEGLTAHKNAVSIRLNSKY